MATKRILIMALIAALAWIGYREVFLMQAVNDDTAVALWAEMELRNADDLSRLAESKQLELDQLTARYQAELDRAKKDATEIRARLANERTEFVQTLKTSDIALVAALQEVAGINDAQIKPLAVEIDKEQVVTWLDLTLRLQDDLIVCQTDCQTRLAEQRLQLVPPLVETANRNAIDLFETQQKYQMVMTQNKYLEKKIRGLNGDVLKWSLISAAAGLIVGGAVGVGIMVAK